MMNNIIPQVWPVYNMSSSLQVIYLIPLKFPVSTLFKYHWVLQTYSYLLLFLKLFLLSINFMNFFKILLLRIHTFFKSNILKYVSYQLQLFIPMIRYERKFLTNNIKQTLKHTTILITFQLIFYLYFKLYSIYT